MSEKDNENKPKGPEAKAEKTDVPAVISPTDDKTTPIREDKGTELMKVVDKMLLTEADEGKSINIYKGLPNAITIKRVLGEGEAVEMTANEENLIIDLGLAKDAANYDFIMTRNKKGWYFRELINGSYLVLIPHRSPDSEFDLVHLGNIDVIDEDVRTSNGKDKLTLTKEDEGLIVYSTRRRDMIRIVHVSDDGESVEVEPIGEDLIRDIPIGHDLGANIIMKKVKDKPGVYEFDLAKERDEGKANVPTKKKRWYQSKEPERLPELPRNKVLYLDLTERKPRTRITYKV